MYLHRKHSYTHRPKSLSCPICLKALSREDSVRRHLMKQHSQGKEDATEFARKNLALINTPARVDSKSSNSY